VPERAAKIAGILKERLLWGLHLGMVRPGDRFASVREIAAEFQVDVRTALRASRVLEADELIVARRRSGTYVAGGQAPVAVAVERNAVVDIFALGLECGIPVTELPRRLAESLRRRRLRLLCVGNHESQTQALADMASRDFGVDAVRVACDACEESRLEEAARHADAAITTVFAATRLGRLFRALGRPAFVATTAPVAHDVLTYRDGPVVVIVADRTWAERAKLAFQGTVLSGARVLVAGEDDLSVIPPEAQVVVAPAAAPLLASQSVAGHVRAVRYALADADARELIRMIVTANGDVNHSAGQ